MEGRGLYQKLSGAEPEGRDELLKYSKLMKANFVLTPGREECLQALVPRRGL